MVVRTSDVVAVDVVTAVVVRASAVVAVTAVVTVEVVVRVSDVVAVVVCDKAVVIVAVPGKYMESIGTALKMIKIRKLFHKNQNVTDDERSDLFTHTRPKSYVMKVGLGTVKFSCTFRSIS